MDILRENLMKDLADPSYPCSRRCRRPLIATLGLAVCFVATSWRGAATTTVTVSQNLPGSPSRQADSCGVGMGTGTSRPLYAPGEFPVQLPSVSLLGARNDLPNPYYPGVHWGQLPESRTWGSTVGLFPAPDGTVWAFDNCAVVGPGECVGSSLDPILQFTKSGRLLKSFGRNMFASPHKMTVDGDGNIWVTDNASGPGLGQQVLKFSPDGKLLMSLGKPGITGTGLDEFDQPTDVAIASNGDIFVADGHAGRGGETGNARIVKFDRNGRFLKTWGRKGMGPGEFDTIHTIALDSQERVFVGDRQNNRIQIFDAEGHFIDQWFQFGRPSGIFIDDDDTIYVADSESRDGRSNTGQPSIPRTGYGFNPGARRGIRIGSARDGTVTAFIPDPCPYPYSAVPTMADGIMADAEGNVYGGDFLGTVRKFVKVK